MTYFEAMLYGVLQGITEYLPISSSAHLILLPKFMETRDPGLAFNVILHLGTLLATAVYFRRDWWNVCSTLPRVGKYFKPSGSVDLAWQPLVIATIPALIAGALFHKWIETTLRGTGVIIATLTVGGVLLFIVDYFLPRKKTVAQLTLSDAFWIGIAQCLALMPGFSRSGATITGGRLLGLDRGAAARFSFLMSGPIIAAAVVYEMRKWQELLGGDIGIGPLFVALLFSFLSGMLAIGGLLRLLRRVGFFGFAFYRVALAVVLVFWFM